MKTFIMLLLLFLSNTFHAAALVNLDTASFEELQSISFVGPVLADQIIIYREVHGPFLRIEDLKNVCSRYRT